MSTLGKFAYGSGALTTAKSVITCQQDTTNQKRSKPFPSRGHLSHVELELDTIAGGATKITWNLAWDANGDHPLHPEIEQDITTGKTTATDGGVAALVDIDFEAPDDASAWTDAEKGGWDGRIFVVAATNVGTCNAKARVFTRP